MIGDLLSVVANAVPVHTTGINWRSVVASASTSGGFLVVAGTSITKYFRNKDKKEREIQLAATEALIAKTIAIPIHEMGLTMERGFDKVSLRLDDHATRIAKTEGALEMINIKRTAPPVAQ